MAVVERTERRPRGAPSLDEQVVVESEFRTPDRPIVRRKFGEIMTGVFLILLGALAFLYFAGGDPTKPVVMMATDVARGEIIAGSDLVQVDVASSVEVSAVDWPQSGSLVGLRAVADLPAGSLPTLSSVVAAPEIPAGFRAVGVVLENGPIPVPGLSAGDVVDVVRVAKDEAPETIAASISVKSSVATPNESEFFVTLIVSEADTELVSSAAQANELRLVGVPS